MFYQGKYILMEEAGNNALSHTKRQEITGHTPFLTIPSLITGTLDDVIIGTDIVFEEVDSGKLQSCIGLRNFVKIEDSEREIIVFDNHNHALYFWLEALKSKKIQKGATLIHIDEHSDLWENPNTLDLEKASSNLEYTWEFVNFFCNVGNYILPAKNTGLIDQMHRVENEFQIEQYETYKIPENSILNIDLDIFSDDLAYIPLEKRYKTIRNLLDQARFVTIATSPYFIDQGKAIEHLRILLQNTEKE